MTDFGGKPDIPDLYVAPTCRSTGDIHTVLFIITSQKGSTHYAKTISGCLYTYVSLFPKEELAQHASSLNNNNNLLFVTTTKNAVNLTTSILQKTL